MKSFLTFLLLLVLIQFIPVSADNPPFDKNDEIVTTPEVKEILKKACYDCHSNEVKYPKYSSIAPISWGIRNHVKQGRIAVNFSTWNGMNSYLKNQRIKRMKRILLSGAMPLSSYIMFHEEAKLTPEELNTLVSWVDNDLMKEVTPNP